MEQLPKKTIKLVKRLAKKFEEPKTSLFAEYFAIFHDPLVQQLPNEEKKHNYTRALLLTVYEPVLV